MHRIAVHLVLCVAAVGCGRSAIENEDARVPAEAVAAPEVRSAEVARIDAEVPRVPEADVSAPAPPDELGPPPALPDGDTVTVAELVTALEAVAVSLEDRPALAADYETWRAAHGLAASEKLWRDYVRVRLVFECVRDGGLWGMRWAITNRAPNSDEVWAQWAKNDGFDASNETATATAECDELSALFAVLVRRLGVEDVGLFWPVWNHVVAVWTVPGEKGPVRVVVPTSQIFLDADASLGTDGFNPWKQKKIYEYRRKDVKDGAKLPAALARWFVDRAWRDGGRSQAELQAQRNARSARLGGS
jgi:hypothetical protein